MRWSAIPRRCAIISSLLSRSAAATAPAHSPAYRLGCDAWRKEVHRALGQDCAFTFCRRIGDRDEPFGGTGGGEAPRCANLNRHQLHDGVQLAGRGLSDPMPYSRYDADGSRHDRKQCHSEHGLSAQLHDPTNQSPGALRTGFAVAVGSAGQIDRRISLNRRLIRRSSRSPFRWPRGRP
jgi:hypothetical protein